MRCSPTAWYDSAMNREPLVQTRTIGSLRIHAIQAGGQKLDGGAMFGVVPKPLWERRIPADERNRIQLGMRCILIEHPSGLILLDTGAGAKDNDKFLEIYGIENRGVEGRTWLEDGLESLGVSPSDVTMVINTHLHFDHAGGNTCVDASGRVRPTFPKARYVVQSGEYRYATITNERTAASYLGPNFIPIAEEGRWDFVDGDRQIAEGISVMPTPGHTPHHQSIVLESDGEKAVYLGDVVPTSAHLPLPWIMGYDVEPLVTLESKRALLARATAEDWLLIFEHDASVPWGRAEHDGKAYRLRPEVAPVLDLTSPGT
jgi:glyoxylase-like metal-dependent hydrolase (beta-lactamase superfamily II)